MKNENVDSKIYKEARKKTKRGESATTRHYYSMPTIITTINGSRIGCPSYHYANSRYLFEIREEEGDVVDSVLTIPEQRCHATPDEIPSDSHDYSFCSPVRARISRIPIVSYDRQRFSSTNDPLPLSPHRDRLRLRKVPLNIAADKQF